MVRWIKQQAGCSDYCATKSSCVFEACYIPPSVTPQRPTTFIVPGLLHNPVDILAAVLMPHELLDLGVVRGPVRWSRQRRAALLLGALLVLLVFLA